MDKFTYYDTIADLLPGIVSIWALSFLGPFNSINYSILLTNNQIIDAVLFISTCFIIGHIIKFLSKYTIEPLMKIVFWRGKFFSEIYLIKDLKFCSEVELNNILSFAEDTLKFQRNDLNTLLDKKVFSDKVKKNKATQLSQTIFRRLDARSRDTSKAIKAHTQNVFYGLFRNLSMLSLALVVLNIMAICFKFTQQTTSLKTNTLISGIIAVIFFIRAKQRGELYVRGVFWSLSED